MAEFEGTFDATWRKGLICKLYKAGVKSLLLTILDSFLTNIYFTNLVNGYISEWFGSDFGLPQRSILSLILILVFSGGFSAYPVESNFQLLNFPSKHPPNESKYVDDYNLWQSSDNIRQLEEEIQ